MENYFNYFTEIEECFRRCRGTPALLSTLDWALIESWKEAGIPLEAVLNGIERTFRKFQKRPKSFRKVNGLGYCSQQVFAAAEELSTALAESGAPQPGSSAAEAPFTIEAVKAFLARILDAVEKSSQACERAGQTVLGHDLCECAAALREVAAREDPQADMESMERQLTAIEDKLTAALMRGTSVEVLAQYRLEIDRGLASARRGMTAPQIESLERQYLKNKLYEHYSIPRLSLFYL